MAGFVMMPFGSTRLHDMMLNEMRSALASHQIAALRADDKQYHDDLFGNVLTYMHGCGFGIAVFERIEREAFNSNVTLEIGYMTALGKPVLLLKDKTPAIFTIGTDWSRGIAGGCPGGSNSFRDPPSGFARSSAQWRLRVDCARAATYSSGSGNTLSVGGGESK